MVRVRFPLPAPESACLSGACGFKAHIAQSVEHFLGKEEVTGSNPVMSSIYSAGGRLCGRPCSFVDVLKNRATQP